MFKKILSINFLFTIVLFSLSAKSQVSLKDSSAFATLIGISYSYQFSGADLSERYGNNSSIGLSCMLKTKNNWLFGADFNYLFGNDVKIYDQIVKNIATSDGQVISKEGVYSDIRMFERGFISTVKIGKLFPVFNSNPNSGIVFLGSAGIIQHQIRIETDNNAAPQLVGDYARGYDRLSNGFVISQFLGYMYLSDKKLTNFFVGIEFNQGWTRSKRDYNFDTMKKDTDRKFDTLWGFKIGWVLPIYNRAPEKFYYN